MQEEGQEVVGITQEIVNSKVGLTILGSTVVGSTASMPLWIEFINSPAAQALTKYSVLLLTITLLAINIFSICRSVRSFMRKDKNLEKFTSRRKTDA